MSGRYMTLTFIRSRHSRQSQAELTPTLHSGFVETLSQFVLDRLVILVLEHRDIGMVAAKHMYDILGDAIAEVPQQGESKRETCAVNSLPRVVALQRLLHEDQSLGTVNPTPFVILTWSSGAARIQEEFQGGELDSLKDVEVQHMVRALFEDTPKRRACIAALVEQ